jgi:hypothetical protein
MKKLVVLLVLFPALAWAQPYLETPPHPVGAQGGSYYTITGLPGYEGQEVEPQPDGSLRADLAGLADGTYTTDIKLCNAWGNCTNPFEKTFSSLPPADLTDATIVRQ